MHLLNAVAFFAGLSTVSAVPMARPRRGFTVNQLAKPTTEGHSRTINYSGIYAKAYAKYGKNAPANIKSAAESGSATTTPEEGDKEYLTPIKVGDTTLHLDIDTGSADLWVFSDKLPSDTQSGHSVYNPTSDASKLDGYSWEISYGDGSGASGDVYKDTVSVGGVTAQGQAVEAASKLSQSFVSDTDNDGLMGLAFSSINTVKPNSQKTFFDTVKDDLDEGVFAVALKHQQPGSYDFGYTDKSKYTGSLTYTDVDNSQGFWMFTAQGYSVGDGDASSSSLTGIADTGTTLLLLPEDVVNAYYQQVSGSNNNQQAGGYTVPCDANLPDFTTIIGSDGYKAVTPGKYIKMSAIDEEGSSCFGGIQSNSGMGFSIFGDVFLKSQYVVFDPQEPRLGFAPQA